MKLAFHFFILIQIPLIFCGQIHTWDLTQDYNNYQIAKEISISFKLDTNLPKESFMRLKLPFSIEGANMYARYIQSDLCSIYYDFKLASIVKSSLSIDSGTNTYLISFYDEYFSNTNTPVTKTMMMADVWYKLVVGFNNVVADGTDTTTPISLSTISGNIDDFIIYDMNNDIGNLMYLSPPLYTLALEASNQSYFNDIQTTNNIIFNLRPSQTILNSGRFKVLLINEKFTFKSVQSCLVQYYQSDISVISTLSNATCELDSLNSLFINIPMTIDFSFNFQINVQIIYPYFRETCQIKVYSMYAYTNTIVEASLSGISLGINQLSWNPSSTTVKIGWGIDMKPRTSNLFSLFRNGPAQAVYNNVQFYFVPSITIPSNSNGKLIISFGSSVTIVPNSFSYNLEGSSVSCSVSSPTITCLNVAGLKTSTVYSISLKISIAYDAASPTTLPSDFGDIFYYPTYKGNYASDSILTNKIYTISIPINNNLDRIYLSTATDYQGVHTKSNIAQTLIAAGYGVQYKGASTYQALEFDLGILPTDFSSSTLGTSAGLNIFTSSVISINPSHTYSNDDCYSTAAGFSSATHIGVCVIKNEQLASDNTIKSTNLRIGYSDSAFAMSAWNAGATYISFGFDNILVSRHASLYIDAGVLDFYVGFAESEFTSTGISKIYYNILLINSFTISIPGTFSSLDLSMSNFWTSTTGTGYLQGDSLSAFIRVTGSLATEEKTMKFFVIFDYLSGFYDPNTEDVIPHCGMSLLGDCKYEQGLDNGGVNYLFLNRYEVSLTGAMSDGENFQFVLPVGTINAQKNIYVFFAGVSSSGTILNIMRYSFTLNPIDMATWDLINTLGYPSITGANYGILNRSENIVGNTETIKINTYQTNSLSTFNPNDASNFGAAFIYATSYKFINTTFSPIFTYPLQGTLAGEKCVYMKYYFLNTNDNYKYVIYCPLYSTLVNTDSSSSLLIKNFKLPYINGVSLPTGSLTTYASLSNNNGLLIHYEKDISESILIPNVLTLAANPLVGSLYIGQKEGVIGFSFSISNPVSYQSKIAVLIYDENEYFYLQVSESINCEIKFANGSSLSSSYTCTQSFTRKKIEANLVFSETTYQLLSENKYVLYFKGVNVLTSTPPSQNFIMRTLTIGGNIIDESISNKLVYVSRTTVEKIQILDVNFEHSNRLARGSLNISFIVGNKTIRTNQYLKFNLQALSPENQENSNNYLCSVRFFDNDSRADLFQTCKFNDYFNEVILTLKEDLSELNIPFKLTFKNVRVPKSMNPTNFYLELYGYNDYPLLISEQYKLPSFTDSQILTYPEIIIYKYFNTMGSSASIIFEIKTQNLNIDATTIILLKFPTYYSPLLSDKSKIIVYINEELVTHVVISDFNIKIYGIQSQIPAQKAFNLTLTSVDLPYIVSTNKLNFFIGFYTNNSTNLIEFGEVNDLSAIISTTPVSNLNVYNLTISRNSTLDYANYDFMILFSTNLTSNENLMIFDFSLDWTAFLYYFPVKCSWKTVSDIYYNDIDCHFVGLQLWLNLTENYTQNIYYIFRINLRNPETLQCNLRKFTINLSPNYTNNITFKSVPSLMNIPKLQFYNQNTLLRWKFEILIDGEYQQITNISIIKGSYSPLIRWSLLNGGYLDENIILTMENVYSNEFKLYPEQPIIQVGTNQTFFRIGAPTTTPPDLYYIFLNILQNPSFVEYGRPDTIHLNVLDGKLMIPSPNLVNIPVAIMGVSLPVSINMESSPPYTSVEVLTQLAYYPDLGLDFIDSDIFVLTVVNPKQSIILKSLYLLDAYFRDTQGYFTLDKTSQSLFELTTVNFQAYLIENNEAALSSANISIFSNFSTKIIIQANLSNVAYLYYHIQNNESALNRSFEEIYNMTQKVFAYDFFDFDEENLGSFYYYTNNTLQNYTIENLRANRTYLFKIWSYDLNGNATLLQTTNFTTLPKNNTFYVRGQINFNESMSAEEITMLTCYFCTYFKMGVIQVYSSENVMCPSNSGYINPNNTNIINNQTNSTLAPLYFHNFNSNSTYFYFIPFDFIENPDNRSITIISQLNISAALVSALNMNFPYKKFPFNTTFINTTYDGFDVNFFDKPLIKSTSSDVKSRYVKTQIVLENNGFIWAIIEKINNIDKNKKNVINIPLKSDFATQNQLLQGFNRSNLSAIGQVFKLFKNTTGIAEISFVDLEPGTNYGIFYMASNEGVEGFRQFTEVKWFSISTPFEYSANLNSCLKILVVLLGILAFV